MATKNQSLERGIEILNLLDGSAAALGVREIARQMDVSPTIVQRLLSTLVDMGFVLQELGSRKYRLGYRAMSLGASLRQSDALIVSAMPELRRLADDHMLNGFLGTVTGDRLIYVLAVQSSGPISIRSVPGQVAHFHTTAMGKAFLAALPEAEARALLGGEPLVKLTERTVTDPQQLMDEVAESRRRGYAISIEENLPGIVAVAAAVRDQTERVIASLSIAFAPGTAPDQDLSKVAHLAVHAAMVISRKLGCPPSLHLAAS